MIIIVKSEQLREERTQKGVVLRKQTAALETGADFALPFEISVQEAYKVGRYTLGPRSFRISRFGGLELDPYGLTLVPVK